MEDTTQEHLDHPPSCLKCGTTQTLIWRVIAYDFAIDGREIEAAR